MNNVIAFDSGANSSTCKSLSQSRPLSPRESLMVSMLIDMSNTEIAEDLGVSVHTVRATLRSAFMKLNASTRTEAYWNWRQTIKTTVELRRAA